MAVRLDTSYLNRFVSPKEIATLQPAVREAHRLLHHKLGPGNDFLGWLTWPTDYDRAELDKLLETAARIRQDSDVLVVLGIGGSYLGARAVIEALTSPNCNLLPKETPNIYFVGNDLSAVHLGEVLALCEGRDVTVNVVSKSGTTTETAVAFRFLKEYLEKRYPKDEARKRIVCTTDREKGKLRELADREGYTTFVIPEDIGGRYSVLTPVGLLPIAVAGIEVKALLSGAALAQRDLMAEELPDNPCYTYAAIRKLLYDRGKHIELLASYEPALSMLSQWFLQLFGESEGKDGKGLYPACAAFTTDLHSLGQYIQDGQRILFETVLDIRQPRRELYIPASADNFDGLGYLEGQSLSHIGRKAMEGTILAHTEGGVPNLVLELPHLDEQELGYLLYFFMKACAVSGYLLGVNPFDQPGVEDYKRNMFALLGKPGYEGRRAELEEKLAGARSGQNIG